MIPSLEKTRRETVAREGALDDDARWAAVVRRDRTFDGRFYTAVETTGIYCRPSCAARHPKRENVRFFGSGADAEAAGFRPCKRCKPDEPAWGDRYAAIIADACRRIETADEWPKLNELAKGAGLSPYHFHRIFKSVAGLTPKAYAMAHRQKRVRDSLDRSETVTEAIYDAGFNSSGRFYATSSGMLGMTPTAFRAGGANADITFAVGECSLGCILVAASAKGVCAIFLGDDPKALARALGDKFPRARLVGGDPDFDRIVARVIAFVEEPRLGLDLPLDMRGTAFQQRVWQALRDIPLGSTASYAEIASRIGAPRSVRAVGGACAANPVAVAIPCHRAVGADGGLTDYRWGVDRKRALLERERD